MKPAQRLEKWLAAQSARRDEEALQPIPATRHLGEQFGVSHATAFRLLCRFEQEGRVWRHPNGRFYPALAGRVLEQPKPLAVMLRKMDSWSALCRAVMEGFTESSGALERNVFLFYNKDLLTQPAASGTISITSVERQREMLEEFWLLHGKQIGGVLLDELWSDEALESALPEGCNGVVFFRQSRIATIGNVAADFGKGASLALNHLRERDYETIFLLNPYPGYPPAEQFISAAKAVYCELFETDFPESQEILLSDPESRSMLIESLLEGKTRCGMICPEDNVSLQFAATLLEKQIPIGRKHGLISAMGTSRAAAHLTTVRYDFTKMGRVAAEMLCEGKPERIKMQPWLSLGSST